MGKEKNIKFLLDSFYKLSKNYSYLKLIIVGDGPAKAELEDYSKELGLSDSIIFTGFVERNRLLHFYSMAHVFIFASKVESQGLVILESMTCGTPVVAIGEMGTTALMHEGLGGFMVNDNLELFTEKVELLLNDSIIHLQKSKEAIILAQKWGIDLMSNKIMEVYEELLIGDYVKV